MHTNAITSCLWFDGQAKEAATFYSTVFKSSKITSENPMVVTFELNGTKFMGLNGGSMFKINPSISFFVTCGTLEEVNEIWDKLIEGGKFLMPIDTYPWSKRYGWLEDKFGVTWQISIANDGGTEQKIRPSMLFTSNQFGKAEEAIRHYTSIFGDSTTDLLILYPDGGDHAGKVMYSEFQLSQQALIAMDGPGVHEYTFNEGVSLMISCETQAEIDHYWEKLTEGGAESMCGWLKDKFGVSWQVVPSIIGKLMSDSEKGGRAMQAIMKMRKLDIETLTNA
ncbi:VOC family protein [Arcicella sp. DC2W]|uniref:VOC family protein n=1 Tax=Arcicella gelida TaxID=2984195 RepID=A0ABU5S588_9BACT|nr:VOC family protein [Arcicella sp. DC2W]MEA5403662.1 VOC family protein [Arcicella sp. DC2W]